MKFREFSIALIQGFFKTNCVVYQVAIRGIWTNRRDRRSNFGGQCRRVLTFHQMRDCHYLLPASTGSQCCRAQKQEA